MMFHKTLDLTMVKFETSKTTITALTHYALFQVSEFTLQIDSSPPPSPPSSYQSCPLHVGCEFNTIGSLKQLRCDLAISNGSQSGRR